jgi:hypothetical protein
MQETRNLAHLKGWAMKILTFKGGRERVGDMAENLMLHQTAKIFKGYIVTRQD